MERHPFYREGDTRLTLERIEMRTSHFEERVVVVDGKAQQVIVRVLLQGIADSSVFFKQRVSHTGCQGGITKNLPKGD